MNLKCYNEAVHKKEKGIKCRIGKQMFARKNIKHMKSCKTSWAELGQAQLKLELELSFTWFKFCGIKLIDKNTTGYFDCR